MKNSNITIDSINQGKLVFLQVHLPNGKRRSVRAGCFVHNGTNFSFSRNHAAIQSAFPTSHALIQDVIDQHIENNADRHLGRVADMLSRDFPSY
jgi:hypothetical protein